MKPNVDLKLVFAVLLLVGAFYALGASIDGNTHADDPGQGQSTPAPDFALPEVGSGQVVRLRDAVTRSPVVFSFWASYCTYCPLEMTKLQAYMEKYNGRIQFYGINADDSADAAQAFEANHQLSLPTLLDSDHAVEKLYDVESLPMLVIVDKHDHVRHFVVGYDPSMDQSIPPLLDKLLAEK
jgi:peroxiredoxin